MNYRSIDDLAHSIRSNLHRLPNDVDLVVGVPRSGLLAASIIALQLNVRLCTLQEFLGNSPLHGENTRKIAGRPFGRPWQAANVVVVDDSILSGASIARVRAQVASIGYAGNVTYCAVYAADDSSCMVDIALECVPAPRVFEWNLLHRDLLTQCCVDIDGVLCRDPTTEENDDGENYLAFVSQVSCQVRPTCVIGHLVSARLERYRAQTVDWLDRNAIRYRQLHLLDLPDAETRRNSQAHASFKASVYRRLDDALLFIESDSAQAAHIANGSGKPVLCHATRTMHYPGTLNAQVRQGARRAASVIRSLAARLRRT
jgi:uncharacterized HAD superfamily protein